MVNVMATSRALALASALVGCSIGPMPSATVTTANPVAQNYFKLQYGVEGTGASRTVSGYVINEYGAPMARVQLLVQALDAADTVLAQKIQFVPGTLPPFGRSYFEIRKLPPADKYRVTVWAFDRVESGDRWP
jgi:hypothetical protein